MIIANAVFYEGTEAEKVFLGENLVWKKSSTPPTPTYEINQFVGKFTDDSTEANWKMYKFSSPNDYTDVTIPVDPETKEFDYELVWSRNYDYLRITSIGRKIQHIYHLPHKFIINLSNGLRGTFDGCNELESCNLDGLAGHSFGNVAFLFSGCIKLKSIDLSILSGNELTDVDCLFQNCEALQTVIFGNDFNVTKCYSFNTFTNNNSLVNVIGVVNGIGASWTDTTNLDLHYSPLTNASAMVFINGLAEVTTAKTIQFKASTYDTLTPEQIAVATSKGWNVVRSAY